MTSARMATNPFLRTEPDRLLREETPSALSLRPLLDVIGNVANRLSEIAGRLGCPATSLSRPISRLQDLGLIAGELPFGEAALLRIVTR